LAAAADDQAQVMRRQGWTVMVARPADKMSTLWKDLARSRTSTFLTAPDVPLEEEQGPAA